MRFFKLSLVLSGCHCMISVIIVPITLWIGNSSMTSAVKDPCLSFLHFATKLFYYPIVSLALYPRHWFPGPWIHVPIILNSLLVGLLVATIIVAWRAFRHARPH